MVMPSRAYSREVNVLHLRLQVQWFGRASAMGRTRPALANHRMPCGKKEDSFLQWTPTTKEFHQAST